LELIKPYYTTKELSRYYGESNNKHWIIYTDSSFRNPEKIKSYPTIKKHLDLFQEIITSVNKPYGLHRSRKEKIFKGEKIFSVRKCLTPTFTYTDFDCYVSRPFNIIKTDRVNLKYLTGFLNSKIVYFWLLHKGKLQGHQFQVDKKPLLETPIILLDWSKQEKIINFVSKIIDNKFSKESKYIEEIESKINHIFYQSFDFNPEEIKIIENSSSLVNNCIAA
ncbi:MAG: TaqI-like C-terminal specificity domain-containing protein, partial [Xenococcus sp. (in: cyanobacteria)]